jgi:hypothetical protein
MRRPFEKKIFRRSERGVFKIYSDVHVYVLIELHVPSSVSFRVVEMEWNR